MHVIFGAKQVHEYAPTSLSTEIWTRIPTSIYRSSVYGQWQEQWNSSETKRAVWRDRGMISAWCEHKHCVVQQWLLIFCICGGLKVSKNICLPPLWHCSSPAQPSLCHAVLPTCHICLRMASIGDTMGSFRSDRSHKHLAWKQIVGPTFSLLPSLFSARNIPEQSRFNPLNPELNPVCYLLALLEVHHFLHVSRIRVKLLTFRLLMSYINGAPILDVSRSHTTTQHSR